MPQKIVTVSIQDWKIRAQESMRRRLVMLTEDAAAIASSPFLSTSAEATSTPDAHMKAVLDELAAFNLPLMEKQPTRSG